MRRTWGLVLAGMACLAVAWAPAAALALPANFTDSTVFSGLRLPISVAFAPDGRIFVAEKGGTIEVFAGPTDTTPTTFADLRTEIFGGWDRGLEAIAIDPQFPARPYIYASYTYDAPIGGTAPTWGAPGQDDDDCPRGDLGRMRRQRPLVEADRRQQRHRQHDEQRAGPDQ